MPAGHLAFVNPGATTSVMDALVDGWVLGRSSDNTHFTIWENELDTPLDEIRKRMQPLWGEPAAKMNGRLEAIVVEHPDR